MHIKSSHDIRNTHFGINHFKSLLTVFFGKASMTIDDAPCNVFKGLCVFLTNGVFLNVSEKKF